MLVDFDLFLRILNRPDGFRAPGQPEDFVRGFQVFDKDGTGFIGVGELKYGNNRLLFVLSQKRLTRLVLTSLGEKLSDDEVEELLKGVNVGKDGSINYNGNCPSMDYANLPRVCTNDPRKLKEIIACSSMDCRNSFICKQFQALTAP